MVAVILFMLIVCKELLVDNYAWKKNFIKWIKYVFVLGVGITVYFIAYKMVLFYLELPPVSATSSNSMEKVSLMTLPIMIEQIKLAYKNFYDFYIGENVILGVGAKYCTILLTIIAAANLVKYVVKKKVPFYNCLPIVFAVLIYPIVALIMSIMMQKGCIDYIVSYGICLFPVILLIVIFGVNKNVTSSFCWGRVSGTFAIVLSLIILYSNISFSNEAYTVQKVLYDRTLSIMTRIMEEIDETEGYVRDETEIVVLETSDPDNVTMLTDQFDSLRGFEEMSVTYLNKFKFFATFLGYEPVVLTDSGIREMYNEMPEVQEMPCYPYKGYCQMIDGRVVVKVRE